MLAQIVDELGINEDELQSFVHYLLLGGRPTGRVREIVRAIPFTYLQDLWRAVYGSLISNPTVYEVAVEDVDFVLKIGRRSRSFIREVVVEARETGVHKLTPEETEKTLKYFTKVCNRWAWKKLRFIAGDADEYARVYGYDPSISMADLEAELMEAVIYGMRMYEWMGVSAKFYGYIAATVRSKVCILIDYHTTRDRARLVQTKKGEFSVTTISHNAPVKADEQGRTSLLDFISKNDQTPESVLAESQLINQVLDLVENKELASLLRSPSTSDEFAKWCTSTQGVDVAEIPDMDLRWYAEKFLNNVGVVGPEPNKLGE